MNGELISSDSGKTCRQLGRVCLRTHRAMLSLREERSFQDDKQTAPGFST